MFLPNHAELFDWRSAPIPVEPWEPEALTHEQWPPDYKAVYAWRIRQLATLENDPAMIASAKEYYRTRPAEFIMHWMDTYNPRKKADKWMPFVFFLRQVDVITLFEELTHDAESGLIEKCRDAGVTWLACGYSVHSWLFADNDAIGWGSRKEALVDKLGDPDSIFEKMRLILRRLPALFLPNGFDEKKHATHMKFINPENGSIIAGEAGDNIGRGGRKRIYFKDEAQPLTAGILTPSGWSTMGDMVVGSVVIGADGKPCTVTHVNNAGNHPVYRVSFSDGTSTECSPNHLWSVEKVYGVRKTLTLRAREIADNFKYVSPQGQTVYKYRVPVCEPVRFADEERDFPLDPYLVGALLGDGSLGSVPNHSPTITSIDGEMIAQFEYLLPEGCTITQDSGNWMTWRLGDVRGRQGWKHKSRSRQAVVDAGIAGMTSGNKRVPSRYMFANPNDRFAVLQGLMDTDGIAANGGSASFHTSSEGLANDVRFIVQSLGGTATLNVKNDLRGYKDQYVLHIMLPNNLVPFRLTRKINAMHPRKHPAGRTIVNIELIGEQPVKCITVDKADGLYLTDNCIVTHNSAHYARPDLIEAALGNNTDIQIDISSVNGLGNVFHRRRENGIDWSPGQKVEPGYVRVLVIDWRDHPEKTQEWYDKGRAKHEREGLLHIWAQEVDRNYSAAVQNTIIAGEWIKAAIDAHLTVGKIDDWLGEWSAALDVADDGLDRNALVKRQGLILRHANEWGERDPGVSTRNVIGDLRQHKGIKIQYDSIGIGASVKSEYNRLVDAEVITPDLIEMVPWNAGASVVDPGYRLIPDDDQSPMNGEFFGNMKAQAWWSLRTRFYKTWRAVTQGIFYPVDELISIDSNCPFLRQIEKELAQPTAGKSAAHLKMIVNKKPDGTRSPNIADAIVMAYFPVPTNYGVAAQGVYGNV